MPLASSSLPYHLILTCEHAGNDVPPGAVYAPLRNHPRLLHSHRGWDPGALELARHLSKAFHIPLHFSRTTRLLVDLNRSTDNPAIFSTFVQYLTPAQRTRVVETFYTPYRTGVERAARTALKSTTPVIHLSIHTFTPVFHGVRRDVDIGILFDPARSLESAFAKAWSKSLAHHTPTLSIRLNQPYKGTDDGLTTTLRAALNSPRYAGIELEVNQRFPRRDGAAWPRLQAAIAKALHDALAALSR